MPCYFIVDTYIDAKKGRGLYDEYIRKVKPIVESFGGEYLVRTEKNHLFASIEKSSAGYHYKISIKTGAGNVFCFRSISKDYERKNREC